MSEIVNLRQARKAKARELDEARAAQNRAKFGRTKSEKERAEMEAERSGKRHDEHKRET